MGQKYPVLITFNNEPKARRYSPEFQTKEEYARSWKSALEKAHRSSGLNAVISCGCRGAGKKLLCVRYFKATDSYSLAKFQLTGSEHELSCEYFELDEKSTGLKGYASGVIREGTDGMLAIRLNIGLTEKDPPEKSDCPPRPPSQRPDGGQTAMTLMGLLNLLWSQAALNSWMPAMAGKRNDGVIRYRLNDAAKHIRSGKNCIADQMFIGIDPRHTGAAEEQEKLLVSTPLKDKRLLLLSTLPRYSEDRHETPLKFLPYRHFGGLPRTFFSSEGQWDNVKTSFPSEYAAWKAGGKVVVFALTSPPAVTQRGISVRAQQIALMHVTENWIPLDSSYEARVATKLDEEKRYYIKPMRFDASVSDVFPDFCLLDTRSDKPFPMEVFGMSTPTYLARKQLKIDYYNRQYGPYGWWYWDATINTGASALPNFPDKRVKQATDKENSIQ